MNTIRRFLLKALVFLGLIWPNIASAWTNPFAGSSRVTNGFWSCNYKCHHLGADIVPSPLDGGVNANDVEVLNICTGVVKEVTYNPYPYQQNYGGRILIECETDDPAISEGVVTILYGHFGIKPDTAEDSDVYYAVGDTVAEGVAIGRLGSYDENSHFVPHLHIGVSRGRYSNEWECGKWRYGGYATHLIPSDACYCKLLDNWYDPQVILGEKEKSLRIVSGSVSPGIGARQDTTFTWTLEATGGYGAPISATVFIINAVTGNEYPFIMEYVDGTSNPYQFTHTGTLNDIGTYGYRFKIETCADKVDEGQTCRSGPDVNEGQVQCIVHPEVCNNQDDNCDGHVDENLSRSCTNECGNSGTSTCHAGRWSDCNATPCQVSSSSSSHRSSSAAISSSSSRGHSSSTSSCIAQREDCNNLDDDCDGHTDENLSRICYDECNNLGSKTCNFGVWGTCIATTQPETCNNVDDNCDGNTDEDLVLECASECGNLGYMTCYWGYWSSCDAIQECQVSSSSSSHRSSSTTTTYSSSSRAQSSSAQIFSSSTSSCIPQPEVCDNQDNDCDSDVDEDIVQSCTNECGNAGSQTCINGGWSMCNATACCVPQTEVCNNRDDNCNDRVDEDLVQSCSNECGNSGFKRCTSGSWSVCDATACPDPTLDAPRITSPADGFIKEADFGISASVMLDWDNVSGAAKYEYEIRYGGFNDSGSLYSQGETSTSSYRFSCATRNYGTEFHWKARAVSAAGVRSAWSETRSVFFSYRIGSIIKCANSACPNPDAWYKVSRDIEDSGIIGVPAFQIIDYVSAACASGTAHSLNYDELIGYNRSARYYGCPP